MKYLLRFNEAFVTLDQDIIKQLTIVRNLIGDEDKEMVDWIEKIIPGDRKEVELTKMDNTLDYNITIDKDSDYYKYNTSKSNKYQPIKTSKVIKMVAPDIPERILSKISTMISSLNDPLPVRIIEGDEIYEAYKCDNGIVTSCMVDLDEDIYNIYTKNPEVIKMAIAEMKGKIVARALIFINTDGEWIMDNVYSGYDQGRISLLKWADSNVDYTIDNNRYDILGHIQLKEFLFDRYPYLDNFMYLDIENGLLSTENDFDSDDVYALNSTSGGYMNLNIKHLTISDIELEHINTSINFLLNLCVDYDDFKEAVIQEQVDYYLSAIDEFIDRFRIEFFDIKKALNDVVNNSTYEVDMEEVEDILDNDDVGGALDIILELDQDVYEDIVRKYLEEYFNDEYPTLKDYLDMYYGDNLDVPFSELSTELRKWVIYIFGEYGSTEVMQNNIRENGYTANDIFFTL